MGQAELQGRGADVHPVILADALDQLDLAAQCRLGFGIVVVLAARQQTGVVGPTHHDAHAAAFAFGKEGVQGFAVVQQGIATGQQEGVGIALLQRQAAGLHQVDAQAPAHDQALFAHLGKGLGRTLHGLGEVVAPGRAVLVLGQVVDPDQVEAVGLEAFQAGLDGAAGAVGGIVEHPLEGQFIDERRRVFRLIGRFQQAADLAAEDEIVARLVGQHLGDTSLRQPGAIVGRGVIEADARVPGGFEGRPGLGVAYLAEHVAQRGTAESEGGDIDTHERSPGVRVCIPTGAPPLLFP